MDKLKKKYDGFVSPVFSVKINGLDLQQKYCNGEIEVELSADYEASSCSIRIFNAFLNDKNKKLKLAGHIQSLCKLGSKIEVLTGYRGSQGEKVFVGYIDTISVEYDRELGICYILDCLDGKGLMMHSFHSESKVNIKKYSDAVQKIAKKYSTFVKIRSSDMDRTDKEVSCLIEQHNESDYNFLVRVAKKLGCCFYLDKGVLVFKPFSKLKKDVYLEFDINQYVFFFSISHSLKNQVAELTVRSYSEKDSSKPFEAKATTYKSLTDSSSVLSQNTALKGTKRILVDYSAGSQQEAKKIAEAKLQELSFGKYQGTIKTIGIPVMTAGKIVEIKGFGSDFDKKYFVKRVIHRIANGRYTTECELEGNK